MQTAVTVYAAPSTATVERVQSIVLMGVVVTAFLNVQIINAAHNMDTVEQVSIIFISDFLYQLFCSPILISYISILGPDFCGGGCQGGPCQFPPDAIFNYCGTSWDDADATCGRTCPDGTDFEVSI